MWTDAVGMLHPRAHAEARVVCLVPSITELLVELGLGTQLVGRTGFCVHPRAQVAGIAKVGGTKDVDLDAVRALRPTHVIVNIDENELAVVQRLREFVPQVVVTHPLGPDDNLLLYRLLGSIFNREREARALCEQLQRELIACRAQPWPPERVLYLIWRDPWMTVAADTYVARVLELVGWNVLHGPGGERGAARYPVLTDLPAAIGRAQRVLLSTEPFMFRHQHVHELRAAFPATPIDLIDGEMTTWYGVRAVRGLQYLRRLRGAALVDAPLAEVAEAD